ncbi:unnamed protein product [Nesidiocoris tenuis]|uniref:Uncharacterized protein n=1 Tax=Nesidiocoris tenuis TaxID=355587 RepID=A0A6H5HQR3_9HEMI|nr:unnamed protein product [Nesidiocoris tenuis]
MEHIRGRCCGVKSPTSWSGWSQNSVKSSQTTRFQLAGSANLVVLCASLWCRSAGVVWSQRKESRRGKGVAKGRIVMEVLHFQQYYERFINGKFTPSAAFTLALPTSFASSFTGPISSLNHLVPSSRHWAILRT